MQQMKEITRSISSTTVTHEKISYNITGKHETSKHNVFHLSKLQGLSWLQKSFTSLSPSKYSRQEPQSKLRKSFIICLTCKKRGVSWSFRSLISTSEMQPRKHKLPLIHCCAWGSNQQISIVIREVKPMSALGISNKNVIPRHHVKPYCTCTKIIIPYNERLCLYLCEQ